MTSLVTTSDLKKDLYSHASVVTSIVDTCVVKFNLLVLVKVSKLTCMCELNFTAQMNTNGLYSRVCKYKLVNLSMDWDRANYFRRNPRIVFRRHFTTQRKKTSLE